MGSLQATAPSSSCLDSTHALLHPRWRSAAMQTPPATVQYLQCPPCPAAACTPAALPDGRGSHTLLRGRDVRAPCWQHEHMSTPGGQQQVRAQHQLVSASAAVPPACCVHTGKRPTPAQGGGRGGCPYCSWSHHMHTAPWWDVCVQHPLSPLAWAASHT